MLIFPAEAADTHLSRRFYYRDIKNLTTDFSTRRFTLLLGHIDKGLIGNGFDKPIT